MCAHWHWNAVPLRTNRISHVPRVDWRETLTIHQLRHTVGSTLIRELPEQIVSRILGHRDPRSTRRYAEVTEEQVRLALAQKR